MTTIERLRTILTALNLTAIDARMETLLENAAKQDPAYGDFLLEVMSTEADARRQRYLKTRLQLAHLPYVKTFEQFDFSFQPSIDERQVRELQTLFVQLFEFFKAWANLSIRCVHRFNPEAKLSTAS